MAPAPFPQSNHSTEARAKLMTEAKIDQALLGLAGVSKRYAFNGEGYYVRARLFAFNEPGGLVMRLPERLRAAALARPGGRAWTMPRTSIRREWIFVPFGDEQDEEIGELAKAACEFVAGAQAP